MIDAYEARPIRPLGLWEDAGWRFKAYAITRPGVPLGPALESAARGATAAVARLPCAHDTHGVGFVGIHQGRGYNQVFVDRWVNQNELLHDVFISDEATPARLAPPPAGHNSVCVWDLALQAFEREAWVAHAMGPNGDVQAYLATRLDAVV